MSEECVLETGLPRTVKDNFYLVNRDDLRKMLQPNDSKRPILRSGETILKIDDTEVLSTDDLMRVIPAGPQRTRVRLLTSVLLPMVDSVKYLGVHIDDDLKYDTQVDKVLNESRKGLALLRKLEPYNLDFKSLQMVKNLYILSRVSYGLESFGPFLTDEQLGPIDLSLRKVARRITGCSDFTRSLPLLWGSGYAANAPSD